MIQDQKIPQSVLIQRLAKRLNYPVTIAHFAVLMHGWAKQHPEQAPLVGTLRMRKHNDGFLWFKPPEVADLSLYAGYDLTSD